MTFREIHPNIRRRLAVSFFFTLTTTMIFPFMAIYFAEAFGAKVTGVLLTFEVLCGLVAGLYGGYLADRMGRKKVMVEAEAVRIVAFLLLVVCNSAWLESAVLTFVMFTVVTICNGMMAPAYQAMVVDVSTPNDRKFIYSTQYWLHNGATAVGGVLGGMLFATHRLELFLIMLAVYAVQFVVLLFFMAETCEGSDLFTEGAECGVLRQLVANYGVVVKDRAFVLFMAATLLALSVEFQARSYTGVRLAAEREDGIALFGILSAEGAALVFLLGMFMTRWTKGIPAKWLLCGGILLEAAGAFAMATSNVPGVLYSAAAVIALAEVLWWPAVQAKLAELVPEHSRSSYMAVNSMVYRAAIMFGSFAITLGGFLPAWSMGLLFAGFGISGLLVYQIRLAPKQDTGLKFAKIYK